MHPSLRLPIPVSLFLMPTLMAESVNTIMSDVPTIIRDRQRAIRREMDRRGIHLKQVAFDSGLSVSTVTSYFPGGEREPAVLPMTALFQIIAGNALPFDLLTLLLPAGNVIVPVPEDIDLDVVEDKARAFLSAKGEAHHRDSEDEREIGAGERAALNDLVADLHAVTG